MKRKTRKRRSGIGISSPLYAIGGKTSLLGFPIQSNALIKTSSPASWSTPESSDPIPTRVRGHRRRPHMAQPLASSKDAPNLPAPEQRVVVAKKHGENLVVVGMLHHAESNKLLVLCHGFAACKDDSIKIDLAAALTKKGMNVFRFDFSGST